MDSETPSQDISMLEASAVIAKLLTLPPEIRDHIWGHCMAIGEDQEPVVVGRGLLLYTTNEQGAWDYPPERFNPSFITTNKQIYGETRDVFYRSNTFTMVLNEGSCIGSIVPWPKSSFKDDPSIAAVPSRWNSVFRHTIRQVLKLKIHAILNLELRNGEQLDIWEADNKKHENWLIVRNAVETICDIVADSKALTSVEIVLVDLGRPELSNGREFGVLSPLARLKRVMHVKVEGVSQSWVQYLGNNMKMDK